MAPAVIAHRGASGTCPENTLAAFRQAEVLGAPMVELDVQRTLDGQVVVFHDFTLDRTTDGTGMLRERTFAQIAGLDAGAWFGASFRGERIPRLADVLSAVTLAVNVELKGAGDAALEQAALDVVAGAGALDRVVFSSFDPDSLVRLRGLSSTAEVAVLWDEGPLPEAVRLAERVRATALHLRNNRLTPESLALASSCHLLVRAWTVNEPAEFHRLARAGAAGIFTDYPERFLLASRD